MNRALTIIARICLVTMITLGWGVVQSQSETVLFETDFSTIPSELEITDDQQNFVEGEIVEETEGSILRIQADTPRILYLSHGGRWANYAIEVRVRVRAGSLIITGRGTQTSCAGYDLVASPEAAELVLQLSAVNCDSKVLDSYRGDLISTDEWLTLQLAMYGSQIEGLIDGEEVLISESGARTVGLPILYVMPDASGEAWVDFASIRIVGTVPPVTSLETYDGTPQEVIAALQELQLVPQGGQLLFLEDYAYFEGRGSWFTPLARNSPRTNIVMAGELTFDSQADDYESCRLIARVNVENDVTSEDLEFGFDNYGNVLLYDYPGEGEFVIADEFFPARLNNDEPQHLLLLLFADRATVYLNGERVFYDVEVELRSGTFGIALFSENSLSRCEGRNIWVYSFDT